MNRPDSHFDIVIVGGGLVGAALACALVDSGLNIAIIESAALPEPLKLDSNRFDPRVSALTASSTQFLRNIGAWSGVQALRACPYRHMTVWDSEGTGKIEFDCSEVAQPALGHIVENSVTRQGLLEQLEGSSIVILEEQSVRALESTESGQGILQMEDGSRLHARLIVAADGAESQIRRQGGFSMRRWDYLHHALVTTVETEKSHQDTAWQVFLNTGPLAFLPLPDSADGRHYCSIVWSLVPDEAQRMMALGDEQFATVLGEAFEQQLGAIVGLDQRYCIPLRQRHARQYVRGSVVLCGDAAHTIHPLAGQGVNLGFMDVAVLAEEILRANKRGDDFAGAHVLARYERRRQGPNLAMMGAMEGFQHLFAADPLPVRWLRNTGMSLTNKLPVVKQELIRRAMGLAGAVPALAKPN